MIRYRSILLAAVAAIVVSVVGTAGAQSRVDAKCHSAIARGVARYQVTGIKTVASCHKARSRGAESLEIDCNEVEQADLKGRLSSARQKTSETIQRVCEDASPAVLALYPRCPSPAADVDDAGATSGIDDFAELAACQLALSDEYMAEIGREILGEPQAVLDSSLRRCQTRIAGAAVRAFKAVARSRGRCQKKQERDAGGLAYVDCAGPSGDNGGKIAKALQTLEDGIDAACDFEVGQALAACGFDAASLKFCVRQRVVEPLSEGLAASAQQLPGTCPAYASFEVRSGSGPRAGTTRVDLGYRGTGHGMDLADGLRGAVELSGCDPDCQNCSISLDTENGSCRCENDATIECSTIAGADPACGGGACRCTFGPPHPQNVGGAPICMVQTFTADVDGATTSLGHYEVDVQLEDGIHTGISQPYPCPLCEEDPVSNDGVRGGVCNGGARNGLPCDGDGSYPHFGVVSRDCPPSMAAKLGARLNRLTFTSSTQSLTAGIVEPDFCAAGPCHCSGCSGDSTVGCSTDQDCNELGLGTCGASVCSGDDSVPCSADLDCVGIGDGTCGSSASYSRQNECTGGPGNCVDDGNGKGACSAGPVDRFCDGFLGLDGRGLLACTSNVDCDANDCNADQLLTPGECGTCNYDSARSCFSETVSVDGRSGVLSGEGGSVFCAASVPPLSGIGALFRNGPGYPGPGRVKLDMDFELYCADGTTLFELPAGSNCP